MESCYPQNRLRVMSSGFTDKLYWRSAGGIHHCFKKLAVPFHPQRSVCVSCDDRTCPKCVEYARPFYRYISLCGAWNSERSDGQAIRRPIAILRCGTCDGAEMERRGWDESGPETVQPEDM